MRNLNPAQGGAEQIALKRHHGLADRLGTAGIDEQFHNHGGLILAKYFVEQLRVFAAAHLPKSAVYQYAAVRGINFRFIS